MKKHLRKDAQGKPLPGWMQPEKPWKRCDGCGCSKQTEATKCSCGGTLKATTKED